MTDARIKLSELKGELDDLNKRIATTKAEDMDALVEEIAEWEKKTGYGQLKKEYDDAVKAYEKAKARQDSIRDDLQHQIDNDHQLITDIKSSIDSLTITISGVIEQSKKNAENIIKQNVKQYDELIQKLETRISNLENEKKNKVYSRWEKITDKIFWIVVAIIFAAVFKYLNFTPPKI